VVAVVLILIYIFLVRPYHMRWGAADAELNLSLPGDGQGAANSVVSTRALTIDAPPAAVWPWLAQMGQQRAGFYSYNWLEDLLAAEMGRADEIVPAWQEIEVGDRLYLQKNGPFVEITALQPERVLALGEGWVFLLQPAAPDATRLIVRSAYEVDDNVGDVVYYYAIYEPIHFVMEAGMMMGIKERAETAVNPNRGAGDE
jgi:hypothetical protein